MKMLTTALALTLTLASQASALSCLRPDVARTFNWAAEADESYVVLYGAFTYPAPPSSDTGDINAPRVVEVDAAFSGAALTLEGFRDIAPLDVTVRLDCAGPWCGGLPEGGGTMLAFVERTEGGYLLSVGPCGGSLFTRVSPADVETVEACMRGEACTETPMR